MSMIVEYGAILKVDFRRFSLPQRKSEFFNRISLDRPSRLTMLETAHLFGLRLVLPFKSISQPSSRLSNCPRCPSHSTGNGPIKSLDVRCADCFPANTSSTISGASNASRMTRLTNEPQDTRFSFGCSLCNESQVVLTYYAPRNNRNVGEK